MTIPKAPTGLGARGKRAWKDMAVEDMAPEQRLLLEETCRTADRLDELNSVISGKGVLEMLRFRLMDDEGRVAEVKFDAAMAEARQQQNVFKQLLVTVRQMEPGKKSQERGSRGSYTKSAPAPATDEVGKKRDGRGWRSA